MGFACRLVLFLAVGMLHAPANEASQPLGSIAGVVLTDEDTPRPVRRAVVTATGAGRDRSLSTLTDDAGRFTIDGVPAGSYAVVASRATFVTSAYAAQRPARLGRPVSVSAGQRVSDLVIRLWRGAALSGTTRDERGNPVAGLTVRAISVVPDAARYLTLTNNPTVTDNQGEFRIFGLEPGEYYLAVQPSPSMAGTALQEAYVDRVLDALRRTGRGVPAPQGSVASDFARDVIYSPVYWPGTVDADLATKIAAGAGTETRGLDLTLIQVPAVSVDGHVTLPNGGPAAGVSVRLKGSATLNDAPVAPYGATTRADGSFSIHGVPAGTYEVSASLPVFEVPRSAGAPPQTLWAVGRVETTGGDVRGLVLQLGAGLRMSGRIQIEDATGRAVPPTGASVALLPASVTSVSPTASLAATVGGAAVMPDGSFVISHLKPGAAYRLFVNGLGPDRWPVSASLGYLDLFDGPAVLDSNHTREPLIVTFSDRQTELFGTLSGDELIGPVVVVVFPSDRTLWGLERRTRAVQPDASGRYRFDNLPAGEYWVGAVGDVDPDAWRVPSFLDQLQNVAVKVALGRGERRQLDIRTRS